MSMYMFMQEGRQCMDKFVTLGFAITKDLVVSRVLLSNNCHVHCVYNIYPHVQTILNSFADTMSQNGNFH